MSYSPSSVLVPFDFSERSFEAIRYAESIVEPSGAVHVAYVIDTFFPAYAPIEHSDIIEEKYRILGARKMTNELEAAGIDCSTLTLHCELGDPGSEIARLAAKLEVELVVVPSRGRTGVKRWWLGSVAERVARLTPCPVLIMKDEATLETASP